ncbi:MAG: peroxidase family protein, partial [Acidobacteriota bacterium]
DWEVNEPARLAKVLKDLEQIQKDFNSSQSGGKKISLADLIVLGGCAAVEQAAKKGGHEVTVPFAPGRTDASQEQTDADTFKVLEPIADGFRNYLRAGDPLSPETRLLERANLLRLTAPEMTVLVGGMRALSTNFGQTRHGVFTEKPETLTNDFFVKLLDVSTAWRPSASEKNVYEGRDRTTGESRWTATAADLVFGAHSQLRSLAEVYAADDAKGKLVQDFVAAWNKVMNLDRYDLVAQGNGGRPRAARTSH